MAGWLADAPTGCWSSDVWLPRWLSCASLQASLFKIIKGFLFVSLFSSHRLSPIVCLVYVLLTSFWLNSVYPVANWPNCWPVHLSSFGLSCHLASRPVKVSFCLLRLFCLCLIYLPPSLHPWKLTSVIILHRIYSFNLSVCLLNARPLQFLLASHSLLCLSACQWGFQSNPVVRPSILAGPMFAPAYLSVCLLLYF